MDVFLGWPIGLLAGPSVKGICWTPRGKVNQDLFKIPCHLKLYKLRECFHM